ncbi:acriflavin resistance protein, partial [Pseudoalteromonas ruthenica]
AIKLTMNNNVSDDQTIAAAKLLEQLVIDIDQQVEQEYGVKMVKNVMVFNMDRTSAQVMAPLVDEELRPFDTFELSRRWRENMPEIAGVKSILVEDEVINLGDDGDFGYLLYGSDIETLNAAGR